MTTIPNPRDYPETVTLQVTTPEESRKILAAIFAADDDDLHPPHVYDLVDIIIRLDNELAAKN